MTSAATEVQTVRPLLLIGLGLVLNVLSPRYDGWDLLPDPLGWVLILIGTWALARDLPSGRLMLASGALALVVSAGQFWPRWGERVRDAEPALLWALSLPALAWLILYCLALSGISRSEPGDAFWWKYLAGMNIGAAVLPVVVYGGKVTQLEGLLAVLMLLGLIGATMISFVHSGRDWAVVRRPA